MPYIHGMSGRLGMLVEYPTSLEREMKTKKSHEIPDAQWGQTPNLQEWIKESKAERDRQKFTMKVKTNPVLESSLPNIFKTFKPNNEDYKDEFSKAKHRVVHDIGVNDNLIVASLTRGDLVIKFNDPTIFIEPHEGGMVVSYHQFTGIHTLTDLSSFVPNDHSGLESCIFSFVCNNRSFEYLIQPTVATRSLDFQLTFEEWDK